MEPVGSHYTVILHHPDLRRAAMQETERPRSGHVSSAGLRLSIIPKHVLRSLTSRVEPEQAVKLAGPRQVASAQLHASFSDRSIVE